MDKIWSFFCSLKLAIVLASAATLVAIAGSLYIPFHPEIFSSMDRMPLSDWLRIAGGRTPEQTWWVFLSGFLIVMLGINTFCCFTDWLLHLRGRWRKTGEYLIHLGFVLFLIAYLIGASFGFRSENNRLVPGQMLAIDQMPGYFVRLDKIEPLVDARGRPVDRVATVTLLLGDTEITQKRIEANQPLTYRGLVILQSTYGQTNTGFVFRKPAGQFISLSEGTVLPLVDGGQVTVLAYFPHALKKGGGRVVKLGEQPNNPALLLQYSHPDGAVEKNWYFLREPFPKQLVDSGLFLHPRQPLYVPHSVLTINRDPGAGLALVGGSSILLGISFALFSFYSKRARGDRPTL